MGNPVRLNKNICITFKTLNMFIFYLAEGLSKIASHDVSVTKTLGNATSVDLLF